MTMMKTKNTWMSTAVLGVGALLMTASPATLAQDAGIPSRGDQAQDPQIGDKDNMRNDGMSEAEMEKKERMEKKEKMGMSDREGMSDQNSMGMMLTAEQKNTVMAEFNDMKESLSDEGDRKELEQEIATLMCKMEIAKQLMKDPEIKQALKQTMASPEGEMMMAEMKTMMAKDHQEMHDDMLADDDQVYDILLMVKAMSISKQMDMGMADKDEMKKEMNMEKKKMKESGNNTTRDMAE